ncbi:MAG: c-type cytochrome [Rhodospirillaceae bacterium]|nr:c-type cytochrome [Rhodospirillaceae bacterium]
MKQLYGPAVAGLAAAALIALAPASAAAESSGRNLALSCFSCHGPAGKSPDTIPGIAGKSAAFIAQEMIAFRDGKRKSSVMMRIGKGYTDAEIKALAGYISGLK